MRSSSPFVWLAIFFVICAGLFTGPAAYAQFLFDGVTIECLEDPALTPNDSVDAPTDSLRITVYIGGENPFADTVQVWIDPSPGLGIFPTPPATFTCPTGDLQGYPMQVTVTRGRGLVDPSDPDSAYIVGVVTVRPEGICYDVGQLVNFSVGARGVNNVASQVQCGQVPRSANLACVVCTGCGLIHYIEVCGFEMDGIIAINDSIWVDSLALLGFDIQSGATIGDTVYVDMRRYTCYAPDSINYGNDTLVIAACALENGTCGDIIQVTRKTWTRGAVGDTTWESIDVNCVRPADNVRPVISSSCIDSCAIINGNYIVNDTLAGCSDVFRIYLGTTADLPHPASGCNGNSYTDFCGNPLRTNFDIAYVGVWFGDFMGDESVPPSINYPHNAAEMGLLCPRDTLIWLSARFGTTPDPGSLNDLIYVDIPINDVLWDSLQKCILTSLAAGDSIFVWGFDDAGNASNWAIDQCDVCLDNVPPTGLTLEIYYDDATCNKRFSPYDSSEFVRYWRNLSPDSIRWYLEKIYAHGFLSPFDMFNEPYVIGFDVRQEPDEDPNGPTGNIVAELNWLNPFAPLPQNWPAQNAQLDTFRWGWFDEGLGVFSLDSAVFVWYGKDGVDTLDAWLGPLNVPCPNGALLGITHARYMDAGGCNAILGSDHDGSTDLLEGYTTLNILHAVVDTCLPGTVLVTDTLHLNPLLPNGPAYGGIPANHTYWWTGPNGGVNPDPVLQFRPKRFFTQGLLDICLIEDLTYRVRVDSVVFVGTDVPYNFVGDTTYFFSDAAPFGTFSPTLWSPVTFDANSVNADSITFSWLHNMFLSYLPDGLYKLTLEIKDNAGNVYSDPLYIWLNGTGPDIDSVMVTQDSAVVGSDCDLNYFSGDHLCVRIETDTTADSVLVDWSCILNIDPALDSNMVTVFTADGMTRVWIACIVVDPSMIDTADYGRNVYQISPYDADCQNPAGNYIINVRAFDGPTLVSEPASGSGCDIAILGDTPCPRLVNSADWFYFYDPDTIEVGSGTVDPDFATFGPSPNWNAISPGSVDSVGAWDANLNWANDQVQDSIFVRLLLDAATVQTDTTDTLVLQFYNPTNGRLREVRKALFVPACANLNGVGPCVDAPDNTIYDGRIELSESNAGLIEFRYVWLGTWFTMAGADSQMLVDWDDQDTIVVRAYTIAGDSMVTDTTFLICDTLARDLDVDNINPDFLEWTGIAPGATDPATGSTATVLNVGPDPVDCPNPGFRFEDMELFAFDVVMSEQVHEAAPGFYPDSAGSRPDGSGNWPITRNWQISAINSSTQDIIIAFGDTVFVVIDSVGEEHLANDSVKYHLYGHFNLPDAWPAGYIMYDVGLVIRSAWDQGGNPGRYNNPPYTDAYENDSSEDTTFFATFVGCDPWAAGCPIVYGEPDGIGNYDPTYGWISAEEDSVVVRATIIETCELTLCAPGVYEDSIHVIEGNFQAITDDPNPWVIPDAVGPWFIFVTDAGDSLGWAREYTWYLVADSADLATIHCDGTALPFTVRFNTYNEPSPPWAMSSMTFENCVQVDVNEPRWSQCVQVLDTLGDGTILSQIDAEYGSLDGISNCEDANEECIDPRDPFTISARFSDDGIDCANGDGIGVDTTQIWADLSQVYDDPNQDNVEPDTVFYVGSNWWVAQWYVTDAAYACLADTFAVFRLHALYDSVGHNDRELYWEDSLFFCSDCLPPELTGVNVFCECDTGLVLSYFPVQLPIRHVSPGSNMTVILGMIDPDADSTLGIDENLAWADLSVIDPALGWTQAPIWATQEDLVPPQDSSTVVWGLPCVYGGTDIFLNQIYNNGDTIKMDFVICDVSGNCDSLFDVPIAVVDTLAPIIDFVYTIGDDSVRAYVTPGDDHVFITADINGYAADLVSNPEQVWADFSRFWCPQDPQYAWYDTVYADHVIQTGPGAFRAYWGGMSQLWEPDELGDTLSVTTDCECFNVGAEGTYDTLWFFVTDEGCNFGSVFSVFEASACDTTVPDVDSVWVMGACAPGWFRGQVGDTIEVWAWLDSLFNGLEDTLRIDSMMADLRAFGAIYNWTEITPDPNRVGGAPCYGVAPDWNEAVPSYWDIEQDCDGRDRLVAKWLVVNDVVWDCADVAWVPVKSQRQTGLNGSHGYYLDMTYGSGEAFTATYDWSVVWGDFTHVTGFPGDPDNNGIDSVLVLQNSVYALDWDSVMTVSVLMDDNCLDGPDGCAYDWSQVFIDFTGFLNDPIQYPTEVFCNVDGNNTDSIVWVIPLYNGGPLFNTSIPSNRYWYPLWLSDYSYCELDDAQVDDGWVTQYCLWEDLDSVISFTIQNAGAVANMMLICDSTTVTCDTNIADAYNMNLWNLENPFNGVSSPDTDFENLYKVYTSGTNWMWYSHEDVNNTRFFIFVEDSVLQCDEIDNDADGLVDELGEGVDFYTADLRINTMPQVAHVDSMNVAGVWINYLWYADNFSEHQYDVDLFISDIYGHRDTLACGQTALTFYEDETCPYGTNLRMWYNDAEVTIRVNQTNQGSLDLQTLTADDSIFVFNNFDSLRVWIFDTYILDEGQIGSGVDLSTDTSPDSSQFNGSSASTIQLRGPDGNVVGIFAQTFYGPYEYFDEGPLTLSRLTDDVLPDGRYTVEIMTLDRMGNACNFSWSFILDQTCPDIVAAYTARAGTNVPTDDLFTAWDYVEIRTQIEDSLDGVDSVWFDYCYDANRDGNLDAYPYWQVVNILSDEGGAWDTEYPFVAYWNIRNLPWSSEDTLGLPPVDPDTCMNRYFVRVRAQDIYGHQCEQVFPVDVTDDIGPVAAVYRFQDYNFTYGPGEGPQSSLVACFNPNTMTDSMMYVCAEDWIDPALLYDPLPGDSFTNALHWFDAYEGIMQYKFFEAPNLYNVGNTDPSAGWVLVHSGLFSNGQDTIIARDDWSQDWCAQLNMAELSREMLAVGQTGHQFNLRFVVFDVCGNSDALNTPVITFRVECDTTSPLAVICFPEPDMCVTNYRCDSSDWVPVQAVVPIFEDMDSIAFFLVDSLSVEGLGIHTFIGGDSDADSTTPQFSYVYSTLLNTNNLISGYYWLYAVAYDSSGLFDTSPLWQRIFVDNTPPTVTSCWVGNTYGDEFEVIGTTNECNSFSLRAFVEDNVGLAQSCGITGVQFQYLDRWGNWRNLVEDTDINDLYGADVYLDIDDGFVTYPEAGGYYELNVNGICEFGNSPLDSIRFRAYAIDDVDWGDNNTQGDANRDCMIDRDQECGVDICCMAIEIRDALPDQTVLHGYNHAWFQWALPQFDEPTTPIISGDYFSTCNYQNPLDTLLLVALVDDEVEDEWLMHFVFWRNGGSTDTMYVPNDVTLNPAIPAIGPIALESTWDSVYVIWTGVRAFIDSADVADGYAYSTWCFASYVTDVTGQAEEINSNNMLCLNFACVPQAPITHVSYVTNDVNNPENRVRVFEAVPYQDFVTDTIEVLYNRTTDPGGNDPEALVLFYTDAAAIMNCHGDTGWEFNLQLWDLDNNVVAGYVCPVNPAEDFAFLDVGKGYDQSPPDDNQNGRYVVGLYLDNTYGPGVYNFAMLVRDWYDFNEGDANLDGNLEGDDSTRIDLVVRVVNVNEPQVVFCYPSYGDACGAHNTVPLSANDVSDPSYFSGEIDTVWFQISEDGVNWSPITDPVTGRTYDLASEEWATVKFELDELEVPGMAGWYYAQQSDPMYSWYAERDLFPDVAVYIWETDDFVDMQESGNGFWTTATTLNTSSDGAECYHYSFVIDANDNGIYEGPEIDRWIDDPRDACTEEFCGDAGLQVGDPAPCSEICLCEFVINFASTQYDDGSYLFRTVVSWHDEVAYHVIENPAPGDSLHVFFVRNVEPEATHDIEFSTTRLNGGLCDTADVVHFVTDIQPYNSNGDLVVEDICMVIYQVSLTNNPFADSSWVNVDTVLSNNDQGWTEGWPGSWTAYNPIADNIDNDGDGLVDETHDVQAGDGIGEENSMFWSRSVVRDLCGNTYVSDAESIWVDVSEPSACITQVGDVAPADNQVVMIPADRDLTIITTDQSFADPGVLAVFQYRTLNPIGPWTNIEADTLSNDTVRHVGNTYTAVWDLYAYFLVDSLFRDPEGWFQLRTIAIDTVNNTDLCDNVVCQITIRLNDNQPAARIEVYSITSESDSAVSCTGEDTWYIMPPAPYCIRAFFAPTNIDTGLASLTFQYQTIEGEGASEWRNIETIWDPIDNGLNGDITECVWFQPRPEEIGEIGFNIRVLIEDYNGNDTSDVVTLYVDGSAPEGTGTAAETILTTTDCGDRCVFNTDNAMVSATFLPDTISHEVNVDSVWMTAVRDDGLFGFSFGGLTRLDDDTWTFDFGGDLCGYWLDHNLDMGCYEFTVHFTDCAGNVGSVTVTTDCGFGATTLVCVDCPIALPDHASLDCMDYVGLDCTAEPDSGNGGDRMQNYGLGTTSVEDCILDGNTEVGNQTVTITGSLPEYQQYVACVRLYVESEEAGVPPTLVDSVCWDTTSHSAGASYTFSWDVSEFPSGYYRVWVLALDAICQLQDAAMADQFWVHVDNAEPTGVITQINGAAPNPAGADTLEIGAGEDNPATFWVDWYDGLTPDDSTQAHNQVQLWAKDAWHPNQADAWFEIGTIPSPCNPHFVLWYPEGFSCGDTLHIVATVTDRWNNGNLDVARAMAAYDSGLFVDVIIIDTTPPSVELFSIGLTDNPTDTTAVPFDQQNHTADINGGWDNDVYLHAFSSLGDESIRRVYFEYSPDCVTWFEIGVDEEAVTPDTCVGMDTPLPWWCEFTGSMGHDILWTMLWDISGLQGDICVRVRAEDQCGQFSDWGQYVVSIDVSAPMARVFVWEADVHVNNLPCFQWTEPQIGDNLERYTVLDVGACPDTTNYDAYGTIWYMKRASDHPLEPWSWCAIGDDSTGPFSSDNLQLWGGTNCTQPEVGGWYDIAVLTTDQNGNELTWTQFLNYAQQGTTWEEKWAWLMANGYVKRFLVVDHIAPVAYDLIVAPDCTPDSSVIFVHGNVTLSATVSNPDVVAVTFAAREAGSNGPWTIIERVEGTAGDFAPVEGYWNTELLNGTYVIGAFAEDGYGNIDGDLSGVGAGPTNTLTVNVDNEPASASIVSVYLTNDPTHTPITSLERGSEVTFQIEASDNFTVRKVRFYYRHAGGDPTAWTQVGGDRNWPFSFNWDVPTDFVVGWTYDFMAVGVDYCEQTDYQDAQGNYLIDWSAPVVDEEANISIITIGGQDAETTPHIHGTDICIVAHSEPLLDYVRFIWIRGNDTTEIRTIAGSIGQTEWSLCQWDVTTIAEGPAQLCAIGSADLGGELVTLATDCRNIVIDHSVPISLGAHTPVSHGLIGGTCGLATSQENVSVGLVMDYSGSMDSALVDMEAAAHTFVNNMNQGDRASVVKFDDEVGVIQGFTDDLNAVNTAIDVPFGGSGTAIYDALAEAAALIQPEQLRKAIVLLTDGEDNSSSISLDSATALAVAAGAPVFVIGLGDGVDSTILAQIASQTGGQLFIAPDPSDLAAIYQEIAQTIFAGNFPDVDDLMVQFLTPPSDPSIDTVYFEYKLAADPNDPTFWNAAGQAVLDQFTNRWAFQWNALQLDCGLITLRAVAWDNAVPEPNVAYVIFADSVRVDNCAPVVAITNINGDVTPEGTEIGQGQVARIVASVTDAFGQGGNSAIARVDFFYTTDGDTFFIGTDANGAPWETYWNTGAAPFGTYTIHAVAYDEAGNCAETNVHIVIVDQLYQRAWIVGYDVDNGLGCFDHLWALTDDCPPNFTTNVMFQYTTDNGQIWINLGEDQSGTAYCDEWLDYNIWGIDVEFDAIPSGAVFRAVATDESGNDDPNPPRFRFSDVSNSAVPVVFHEDWVRVPVTSGQVPWVFSTLEDYTEACPVQSALVCVQPVNGDPTRYAGPVPGETSLCNLNGRDGQLTVFRSIPVTQGNFTFMQITAFELNIHQVTTQGGSNGWLASEDIQMQLFVPPSGAVGTGTEWFEPTWYDSAVNLIPPSQYYYTLISEVENIMSNNLGNGTVQSHLRMHFNPALLPPNPQQWQVVAAYWDASAQIWSEVGIVYETRNFQTGQIDFQWLVDWDVSTGDVEHGCPSTARFAVFFTVAQPLSGNVQFADSDCETAPDSTYYTPTRGPTTDCTPTFWAILRQGEYTPPESTIDVYLDGVRIINDGVSTDTEDDEAMFLTAYDQLSGQYSVWFNPDGSDNPPYFGCLGAGQHYVQIFVNNQSTTNTPFFVDVTAPEAFTTPGYVNHQITLWANLTDLESGVDTNNVEVDVFNCDYYGGDVYYEIHQDAMTFVPIANGYRASVTVEWEAIQYLWYESDEPCLNPQSMCVEWEFVANKVCLDNEDDGNETEYYTYFIDIEPPMVSAISPIGAPIDEDGDGLTNEDWRDCLNNDNDYWWSDDCDCWMPRIDEDPVNFVADTFNCGERLTLSAAINDLTMCCSGASQVDMRNFQLWIDGIVFARTDTANHGLNFHIFQQFGNDDAVFTWGGPSSGAAADFAYTPGQHQIIVNAADSVGNVGSQGFSWTYYVRCSGPSIEFEPTDCGVWFNPEGSNNQFGFSVETTVNMPIAPNGIWYEVRTVPEGERISGPTTIDPDGQDSVHVTYFLGGSFPDGQQGIEVIVTAVNELWNPEVDTLNGITHSRMTFWADNCAPTCVSHTPGDSATFTRDEAIVVEVFFTDDCAGTPGPNSIGGPDDLNVTRSTPRATVMVGRLDAKGNIVPISKSVVDVPEARDDRGRNPLDDNGSGISLECFDMNIISPSGDNIGPENEDDYLELDAAHAKFVVPAGQNPGAYTVDVTLCDCVGNLGGCSWRFNVSSVAPAIAFCPVENDSCSYDGYWNPDLPLHLCATVRETDNVNTNLSGIRVDILRVYVCEGGLCTDTLMANAQYDISEMPDPNNRNQLYTISANYNFDENLAATELRIVVSATNLLGQTATRSQSWIVDATPPTISIVSPLPNSVVSNAQAVVISANFSDATFDSSASFHKNGVTDGKRGSGRLDEDNGNGGSSRGTLGSWKSHVAGGRLDDLDGDSGVDPSCIELILIPLNGGAPQNLTAAAYFADGNITWIGPLAEGGYTVVLSVCDRVCNTSSINWSFTVTSGEPCFIFTDPCYVSSPQHTFVFRRSCENVDLSSLHLTIEGRDSSGAFITVISGAPVQSAGDSSWYDANIPNLFEFNGLRLTLTGTFNGGSPLPTVTHVCVVDVFGPAITSLSPNPADTLWLAREQAVTPTFIMTFVELGNTTLNGSATRLWLTFNGEVVATDPQVTIDPAGTSGTATLPVQAPGLEVGDYILNAYVADIAGNSTTMHWTYRVRAVVVPELVKLGEEAPYAYPNPFMPGDVAKFHISLTGNVGSASLEIKIYDFSGQFVATVWDGSYSPSAGDPEWAGVNENNEQIANGVYLAHVRVSAGGETREEILKVAFKNQQK